jgi:hypothetical protein
MGLLVLQELSKIASKKQTVRRDAGFNIGKILPKQMGKYEINYDFVIPLFNQQLPQIEP